MITQLFRKESSKDAFRNIVCICFPIALTLFGISLPTIVAAIVGTLLACLTDLPGNREDKRTTAQWCIPLFFIASYSTSYALHHLTWLLIPILAIAGFCFTFMMVLGTRIGFVGNLSLIVISFTIGLRPHQDLYFAIALTAGAAWFFVVSLIQSYIFPYRSLKYAMNDGFENMAKLLRLKIKCYDESEPLDIVFKELSLLHIKISDQLEIIRSLVLREKAILGDNDFSKKVWLNKIYYLIDFYELLMAIDEDYEIIRKELSGTGALESIQKTLSILSEETSNIVNSKSSIRRQLLEDQIETLSEILKQTQSAKIKSIITSVLSHLNQILSIVDAIKLGKTYKDQSWLDSNVYSHFIAAPITWSTLKSNLNLKSSITVYAIRVSALLTIGGLIGILLPDFRYASWILLTIILVARPSYIVTQKRNYQRIVGSMIGIAISTLIVIFIATPYILIALIILCLYGFLLFNKPNYLVCVIFITITIIISLNIYEGNIIDLLGSRIAFTLIGSLFAVLGCFILPINHHNTLESLTTNLTSNYKQYLTKIQQQINEGFINFYDLRLARKHAQTSLAQFYDVMDQFQKDPINRKIKHNNYNHLSTLAYRINALLVGMSVSISKSNESDLNVEIAPRLAFIQGLINDFQSEMDQIKISKQKK